MGDVYLLRTAIHDLLRPRRLVPASLFLLLPGVIALVWRSLATHGFQPRPAYDHLANLLIFGFMLVMLSLLFGSGVVTEEVEQKTIVYLLTRPIPRWRILTAKFLAAWVTISVALCASVLFLALTAYGPTRLGHSPLGRDLLVLPVGALAYGSLFLMLAILMKRPLFAGLFLAFVWESLVPNLPGSFERASLISYIRALTPHPTMQSDSVDLNQLASAVTPGAIPHLTAWCVLFGASLLFLMVALLVFSAGEFVPREDD